MKEITKPYVVTSLIAFLFLSLPGVGCQDRSMNPEKPLDSSRLEKKRTEWEKALESLKTKGVIIPCHEGTVDGGERVVSRGSANIAYFSGSEADLEPLARVKSLQNVTIMGDFTDQMMGRVVKAQGIQFLSLQELPISDTGFAELSGLSSLKTLMVSNLGNITDKAIDKLADMVALEHLVLRAPQVTDEGLRRFGRLKNLRSLELDTPMISDAALNELGKLHSLETIRLSGRRISDVGIGKLAANQSLEDVILTQSAVTNTSMELFSKLKTLRILGIGESKIDNDGLKYCADFPKLEKLMLGSADISDEGLKHLNKTKLRYLSLRSDRITDKGLRYLAEVPSLQVVNLEGTKVTPEGIRQLQMALPGIKTGPFKK